jgi:single-strand DNA-binding protein
MNLIILKGRLTKDIELKTTTNGTPVAAFSLAVDRNYTPKGQEKQTDFINCVAWRNTAEFISKWFSKGSAMLVRGELQARNYEDKNGNKRTAFEVIVDTAEFCESKRNTSEQTNEQPAANNDDFQEITGLDDDLPF